MFKKFNTTDVRLVLALSIICVAALAATWVGVQKFERELTVTGTITGANQRTASWREHWATRLQDLDGLLQGKPLSAKDQQLFDYTLTLSGAYRYKIYSADGIAVGASRKSDLGKKNTKPYFSGIVAKGKPYTKIARKSAAEVERDARATGQTPMNVQQDQHYVEHKRMRTVTETYIPFMKDGRFLGAIEIYADTTHTAAAHQEMADYLKYGLIGLFVSLFLLCGFFIGQNIRQRNRDMKALSAAEAAANKAEAQARKANKDLEATIQDLSDSQMKLLQAERLSTLGRVTATVSHEIRNPLGAIRNSLYVIREAAEARGLNLTRPLDRMQRSVARCDTIIGDLLEYTRTKDLSLVNFSGSEYLNELLDEQAIPDGITLERQLPDPGPQIAVDQDRFPRIMINLIENAAQAIKESGAEEGKITVSIEEMDGGQTAIRVTDNGPGIPDDVLAKIFEPLFTTKSFGAGLGLPTVKQLVEQHGAELTIETEVGVGTTFSVVLRNAADAAMLKEAEAA